MKKFKPTPAVLLKAFGLPVPEAEFKFHPERRWRFDLAWPDVFVALEIDGGLFIGGRHTRAIGFIKDMEKLNQAVLLGWKVLRCTPAQFSSGEIIPLLLEVLKRARKNNDGASE